MADRQRHPIVKVALAPASVRRNAFLPVQGGNRREDQEGRQGRPHSRIILTEVSWASTFKRFRPGRVPLVGRVGLLVADWSQPQKGFAPMFDAPLLERLSVVHPAVPTAVYGPAGAYFLWQSATSDTVGTRAAVALYLAGLLAWSLLEYVMHRISFHHEPRTGGQLAFAYLVHGVHHAYPDDSRRWMMPIAVTIPLAIAFYLLFRLALGPYASGAFGGFVHGYLSYDLIHYFVHRGRVPTRVGRFLRRYHMAHHYAVPDRHFGVSSPLWDVIFRTR